MPEQRTGPADPAAGGPVRGSAEATRHGAGRVLIAVYAVFALSASARAGYQLVTEWSTAPLAHLLSALAAAVYVVATLALARATEGSRRVAWAAVGVELVGVLAVGALSVADPAAFPEATVWSGFGRGYGFIPLVLPVLGLMWLRHLAGVQNSPPPKSPPKSSPPPKSPPPSA